MTADPRFYLSPRLANYYAFHRPPIHAEIWARIIATCPPDHEVLSALDVGCGAGASTLALSSHARCVTGVDPSEAMLRHARLALPDATFVLGISESLPLKAESYDLVAAAGSLNYSEPVAALREVSRVLRPSGRFVSYDFSTGRIGADAPREAAGFKRFRESFAPLSGYALDLKTLPYEQCALRLVAFEEFDVHLAMSAEAYVEYLLGETNVEAAIAGGMGEVEARRICVEAFAPLFENRARVVRFAAVFAVASKAGGAGGAGDSDA